MQWRIQDFPEEGAPTPQGGRQHTNLSNFPKNCMKLKEFGPPGGARVPCAPLRSATAMDICLIKQITKFWNLFFFERTPLARKK